MGRTTINSESVTSRAMRGICLGVALFASALVSACVSDTLSQQDTTPQTVSNNPNFDPAQRDQAIAEMRAKAAQPGSGVLTNAYADGDGATRPMTSQEQASGIVELQQAAQDNAQTVTDPELEEKQRSIRQLQYEAQRHYSDAVKNIAN